jgi:hypothetical protein
METEASAFSETYVGKSLLDYADSNSRRVPLSVTFVRIIDGLYKDV